MSDTSSEPTAPSPEEQDLQNRRLFLRSLGKWSGAAIAAAVVGTWFVSAPQAQAGGWVNRRGGGGGAWANHAGGGGAWANRYGGGGGAWANRYGGSAGWVNRYGGGGAWANRYAGGGGAWVNRW
jgi:hypothetical protein